MLLWAVWHFVVFLTISFAFSGVGEFDGENNGFRGGLHEAGRQGQEKPNQRGKESRCILQGRVEGCLPKALEYQPLDRASGVLCLIASAAEHCFVHVALSQASSSLKNLTLDSNAHVLEFQI